MNTIKSGLGKKSTKNSFSGGGFSKAGLGTAIEGSADFVTGIQNQMFEDMKSNILSKTDDRDNPNSTLKKINRIDSLKNINEGGANVKKSYLQPDGVYTINKL